MSEKTFKASNGYKIVNAGGRFIVYDKHGGIYTHITSLLGDVIREYFQHQRDEDQAYDLWKDQQIMDEHEKEQERRND